MCTQLFAGLSLMLFVPSHILLVHPSRTDGRIPANQNVCMGSVCHLPLHTGLISNSELTL